MGEPCEYPDCPPYEIIRDISADIKEVLAQVNKQGIVNNELVNLCREVREMKVDNKKDHDEVFQRLRDLEMHTVSKGDMKGIVTVIGLVFAGITLIINLIINVAVK